MMESAVRLGSGVRLLQAGGAGVQLFCSVRAAIQCGSRAGCVRRGARGCLCCCCSYASQGTQPTALRWNRREPGRSAISQLAALHQLKQRSAGVVQLPGATPPVTLLTTNWLKTHYSALRSAHIFSMSEPRTSRGRRLHRSNIYSELEGGAASAPRSGESELVIIVQTGAVGHVHNTTQMLAPRQRH